MLRFRYNDYRFALQWENIFKNSLKTGCYVLDDGCGAGFFTTLLASMGFQVTAVDYDRQVFRAITLIMQFGINMLVPICLMSAAGIWLDKHFGTDFWMILLFCMGAVAGGQNVYRMARTIYEDGDDKHTKKDK